jgi:hypothetical protein
MKGNMRVLSFYLAFIIGTEGVFTAYKKGCGGGRNRGAKVKQWA